MKIGREIVTTEALTVKTALHHATFRLAFPLESGDARLWPDDGRRLSDDRDAFFEPSDHGTGPD